MPETRRRFFQPQTKEPAPDPRLLLEALIEEATQREPSRTLLAIEERHSPLEPKDPTEVVLLFEAEAPERVRQAVEAACQLDPDRFYSYRVIVDHRLGENVTLLVQEHNPRPDFSGTLPPMDGWISQLEQAGLARRIAGLDPYTLHLVCSVDGQMPHLYYFRTPETLDELRDDLWRIPQPRATGPQSHFSGSVPFQADMFT